MSDPSDATLAASAERLAAALVALGVVQFDSLDKLLSWKPEQGASRITAGLTIGPSIRIQEHHDITPALFIYDPFLGTIGLVEILPSTAVCTSEEVEGATARASAPAPASLPKVTESIREFVDRAAYFRQLCLLHAERTETQAHSIELVIVFQPHHSPEAKTDAAAVLHSLSSETGYMRSIGVNLLDEKPDGAFTQLTDTFPWLLSATRRWFNSPHIKREASGSENLPWGVALRNYRHAGGRRYRFVPGRFHLVHGYNGSGKSSLSEALELLLVRSIERLDKRKKLRYFPFVRFQPATPGAAAVTPATVTLRMGTPSGAIKAKVSICPPVNDTDAERRHRWNRPMVPLPSAASFRLDQRLMDSIIQASDAERAAFFLRAYFPGDQSTFDAEASARDTAATAFASLPRLVRDSAADPVDRAAVLRETLAWTSGQPAAWQPRVLRGEMLQMIAPCLPVTADGLALLAVLQPSLRDRITEWHERPTTITDIREQLQKLDQDVASLHAIIPAALHNLDVALPILRQFNAWRAEQQAVPLHTFRESVDRWLELQALADLVAKYHDVAATLERARALGWRPRPEHQGLLDDVHEPPERVELLDKCRQELAKDRDEARASVRSFTQETAAAAVAGGAAGSTALLHFTDEQLTCLNVIGAWLPSCAAGPDVPALGEMLRTARRENRTQTRGKSSIGVPGGLDAAIAEGERLVDACRSLNDSRSSAVDAYDNCVKAVQAFNAVEQFEQKAMATFFRQLEQKNAEGLALLDALNELLSLFKPAPWAYTGVTLEAVKRSDEAPEQLALRRAAGDKSEAELLLNTAEMNTFTLALFFLCAAGVDNPLKLLVLDDPLQNMDEMTVSSLARGLGKVMRVFPDGWRVLALFHGEEDVYRLRDEIQTSVYRLPWVSPTTAPAMATTTIEAVAMHGTERIELQNISQIVAVRLVSAAAV